MRKTKIICTLGPSTRDDNVIRELMYAGMNVARFNFSHGTQNDHKIMLERITRIREELHLPIATLLDTRGPKSALNHLRTAKPSLKRVKHLPSSPMRLRETKTEFP